MDLSREASDTMLAGGEPIVGTRWKTEPDFRAKLAQLYRDVRLPGISAPAKGARPRDVNALR
jgi:salicylate hydroxylase